MKSLIAGVIIGLFLALVAQNFYALQEFTNNLFDAEMTVQIKR